MRVVATALAGKALECASFLSPRLRSLCSEQTPGHSCCPGDNPWTCFPPMATLTFLPVFEAFLGAGTSSFSFTKALYAGDAWQRKLLVSQEG